jgi:3-isopropylmalate/(R)-2-methylmalate dehydratase small subunit
MAQRAAGGRSETAGLDRVEGRGCVLRGDDIDTDRIIPARYLRCVTFDGIGEHAFSDDRKQAKGDHPLDDPRFRGASILIVGRSFAEIFAGNCTALGLPCVTLGERDLEALMDSVSLDPAQRIVIDLAARTLTSRAGTVAAGLRDGVRKALLEGSWNATAVLIEAGDAIERTAARLPYASGFAT